jgi:hypothetical protein
MIIDKRTKNKERPFNFLAPPSWTDAEVELAKSLISAVFNRAASRGPGFDSQHYQKKN